jgi:glycosyltransferase involved in cell wall biosynthesis
LARSNPDIPVHGEAIAITLVIPAFNEAGRIAHTLTTAIDALNELDESWELLVIDDGSTDLTAEISASIAASEPAVRVISLPHRGKASSVAHGLSVANGDVVLFSDADLATPLRYLEPFIERSRAGADVVIASREGMDAHRIGEPEYRHVMGRVFNRLVQWLLLPGIEDTQCGFKLFTREAAREITKRTLLYRDLREVTGARVTAFDVEMLVIARRLGYRIDTIPVEWVYGTNSKVSPLRDSIQNGRDLLTIKLNDLRGRYGR